MFNAIANANQNINSLFQGGLRVGNQGKASQAQANQAKSVNEMVNALNKHLAKDGVSPIEKVDPKDVRPKAVADRILTFVDRAMEAAKSRGASDAELETMLSQAKEGVAKGFGEARDVLDNMGVLEGKIEKDIDDTFSRINEGLDDRQEALTGLPTTYAPESKGVSSLSTYESISYAERQSYELEVITADGDRVNLSIAAENAYAESEQMQVDGNGFSYQSETARFESLAVSYRIEGDIDEGEKAAIMDLVAKVDDVADTFFGGDLQAAFQQAGQIELDTSELNAFAFDLQHAESVTTTTAYEAVQQYDAPTATSQVADANPANEILKAAESFLEKMVKLLEKAQEDSAIQNPIDTTKDMLGNAIQADPRFPSAYGSITPSLDENPIGQLIDKVAKNFGY